MTYWELLSYGNKYNNKKRPRKTRKLGLETVTTQTHKSLSSPFFSIETKLVKITTLRYLSIHGQTLSQKTQRDYSMTVNSNKT